MKNFYLIIALSIGAFGQAQIVNIPDANFKNALVNTLCVDTNNDGIADSNADTNNDGEIQVSEAEGVLRLTVYDENISSLDGIQYFINLIYLNCVKNNISELDLNQNINIEQLNCDKNEITNLSFDNNISLRNLSCSNNQLTNLDISQNNNLESIECRNNQLFDLNLSNAMNVWNLGISNNNLTNLDVSDCSQLQWIFAGYNNLESFDISQISRVMYLELQNNNLLTLNISGGHTNRLTLVDGRGNPNLECIEVDDIDFALSRFCTRDFWCIGPPYNPNSYYSEDCSLGTAEFGNLEFSIYPNPVKDVLTVNSQEPINLIKIYSITGKLLKENTNLNIDVSDLASGLYLVMVTINEWNDTKKFIKI